MKSTTISHEEWAAGVTALAHVKQLIYQDETVPPGFLTRRQWGQAWNLGEAQTRHLLFLAISNGTMETQSFKIHQGAVFRKIPHYRLVKNEKRSSNRNTPRVRS